MKSTIIEKEKRDSHSRKKIFFYPQQHLLQELEIDSSTSQASLS